MRYILGIPSVNRPDLLKLALQSVKTLWPHTLIVDNSELGLDPTAWPVKIVRPSVPLTTSQTMNLLQILAAQESCDALFFMHDDAEAGKGTADRLVAIVGELVAAQQRSWGMVFTNYDTLAGFNMDMVNAVGRWDVTLPQYFADTDYYFRSQLAGFDIIESGLGVTHHNNASSTIKKDPLRVFVNDKTFPLYEKFYLEKWGGSPGEETYDWPFDGALAMSLVECLCKKEVFRMLAGLYETNEGCLLENSDRETAAAQLETLQYAMRITRPAKIIETGTCKSMFGYVLSHLTQDVKLHTFDGDPRCEAGVRLLNESQSNVRSEFVPGDTKQTLLSFNAGGVDFAWIDGGHDEATALSDIQQAMRLDIPLIAVDDARIMPEVSRAIHRATHDDPRYTRLRNPFFNHDSRGIVLLYLSQGRAALPVFGRET